MPTNLCGSETILVVEDDEQVRKVNLTILLRNGYHVLEARDAGDALLVSEKFSDDIHLLLTDVVMPRMSGRELADRLALTRPKMRVLYLSGYAQSSVLQNGLAEPGIVLLQKPTTPDVLLFKVREVLSSPELR